MTHLSQGRLPKGEALTKKKKNNKKVVKGVTERPRHLKMNGFWGGGGLSHLADWVTASQKSAHTIGSNMDVIKKKNTPHIIGPVCGKSVQNPGADYVGEHNDGMSASRIEWRLTLHPKIPIWDNNICQGKGGDSQGFGRLCGPADQSMQWHQTRGQTPKLCQKKRSDVIVITLCYDAIVLSVVDF